MFLECSLDGEYVTIAQLGRIMSDKLESECDDDSGAMIVKRLRDSLGGQIITMNLIRHVPQKVAKLIA